MFKNHNKVQVKILLKVMTIKLSNKRFKKRSNHNNLIMVNMILVS